MHAHMYPGFLLLVGMWHHALWWCSWSWRAVITCKGFHKHRYPSHFKIYNPSSFNPILTLSVSLHPIIPQSISCHAMDEFSVFRCWEKPTGKVTHMTSVLVYATPTCLLCTTTVVVCMVYMYKSWCHSVTICVGWILHVLFVVHIPSFVQIKLYKYVNIFIIHQKLAGVWLDT